MNAIINRPARPWLSPHVHNPAISDRTPLSTTHLSNDRVWFFSLSISLCCKTSAGLIPPTSNPLLFSPTPFFSPPTTPRLLPWSSPASPEGVALVAPSAGLSLLEVAILRVLDSLSTSPLAADTEEGDRLAPSPVFAAAAAATALVTPSVVHRDCHIKRVFVQSVIESKWYFMLVRVDIVKKQIRANRSEILTVFVCRPRKKELTARNHTISRIALSRFIKPTKTTLRKTKNSRKNAQTITMHYWLIDSLINLPFKIGCGYKPRRIHQIETINATPNVTSYSSLNITKRQSKHA